MKITPGDLDRRKLETTSTQVQVTDDNKKNSISIVFHKNTNLSTYIIILYC